MATALNKTIRRELEIDNLRYTVTISPDAVRIARKGRRKGHELTWRSLLSGEAELMSALQQSLHSKKH